VAEAAGIAEGTLFRVFATKDDLIDEVVADVMDPRASCTAISQISSDLPLDARLTEVMDILTARIREITGFFLAMRLAPKERSDEQARSARESHSAHTRMVTEAVTEVIGADAARLRVPADQAARYVWSVAFVTGHPMIGAEFDTSSELAVQIMLHGLLSTPTCPPATPSRTREC